MATWGMGVAIGIVLLVLAVVLLKGNTDKDNEEENRLTVHWSFIHENAGAELLLTEENTEEPVSEENAASVPSEETSSEESAPSENEVAQEDEEASESEEPLEPIGEEPVSEVPDNPSIDLSDPASVVANWELIPAGTVISRESIDFDNIGQYFIMYEISEEVYGFINNKSYRENPNVGLGDLRYFKLLHYNFNHELQVGELIVAADLQSDFIGIFTELFVAEYEIQSMYLPDNYWTGDPTSTDSASIDVNNTSCFMYRPATGSGKLSKHSYGRAIDINPQQNPYVSYTSGSPVWSHENANDYIDRTTGLPHVITEEDICYQIFIKYGFTWGGSWANIKDYQHFQK
ncbi:MAG: M15 family metallopeptidase [Lachnospiraceae bacterium]|nr:M15 family metallopeptidase [Lachnospiraceae bacterium]